VIKEEIIPIVNHSYNSIITPPTCEEKGYTTHKCIWCSKAYIDTYTDETGHNYKETITKPTCTNQGYTTHKCSKCSDSYVDTYVEKLGHDLIIDEAVEPTCKSEIFK
jgi:hypothetical protein